MSEITHVAVAVIENSQQQICISYREIHLHQGGLWEFPGGKLEHNETAEQALVREIKEELNLDIRSWYQLTKIEHQYSDKRVCLHVFRITSYTGTAVGLEKQAVKWVDKKDLFNYTFPEANSPIVRLLNLPDKYLITGRFSGINDFSEKLAAALNNGITLVQLRLKHDSFDNLADAQPYIEYSARACEQHQALLMLNLTSDYYTAVKLDEISYAGIHADSGTLQQLTQRPSGLFCASCHTEAELEKAAALHADFMVLSPVQQTNSHPDSDPLGWDNFASMIKPLSIPVYALGGVGPQDIMKAREYGALGVAAISALWN